MKGLLKTLSILMTLTILAGCATNVDGSEHEVSSPPSVSVLMEPVSDTDITDATESDEEIFIEDGEFCCSGVQWGDSFDTVNAQVQLEAFLDGNNGEDNSNDKRSYYIPSGIVVDITLCGTTYSVKPLYEFEYGNLKNISYTFCDLSALDETALLESLTQSFGEYEENTVEAPSISQYNWVKDATKCTLSLSFSDGDLTVASMNVMSLEDESLAGPESSIEHPD